MKLLLLIVLLLMILAGVIFARSDTVLKDLITGEPWQGDKKEWTFNPNGVLNIDVEGSVKMGWYIKDGVLEIIDTPETEGIDPAKWEGKSGGYWYNYTILLLTKHELLIQEKRGKDYIFMHR